jgi:hypothetical protein
MFEISVPSDGQDESYAYGRIGDAGITTIRSVHPAGKSKIFLPRRSGESSFGPCQYYYVASRTGVVPSWRFAE